MKEIDQGKTNLKGVEERSSNRLYAPRRAPRVLQKIAVNYHSAPVKTVVDSNLLTFPPTWVNCTTRYSNCQSKMRHIPSRHLCLSYASSSIYASSLLVAIHV